MSKIYNKIVFLSCTLHKNYFNKNLPALDKRNIKLCRDTIEKVKC
jgi:hypothetical protein